MNLVDTETKGLILDAMRMTVDDLKEGLALERLKLDGRAYVLHRRSQLSEVVLQAIFELTQWERQYRGLDDIEDRARLEYRARTGRMIDGAEAEEATT